MKKIILSLIMLCCLTAAWAEGTGDGSKDHPYTGEWNAAELKEGDYLAFNCIITGAGITVFDDKLNNAQIVPNWADWAVGSAIANAPTDESEANPFRVYKDYCSVNTPEQRKKHTFIITHIERSKDNKIYITGHYSGCYDLRGDGSKEHPYSGEWSIPELFERLNEGDHIAIDCVIKGEAITIVDVRLNKTVASIWRAWSPGNFIGQTLQGYYIQYGKDNPWENRKGQTFIVTKIDHHDPTIFGYFSGFYTTPDADGFVYVESAEQMKIILGGNNNVNANTQAKIKLTDDIYLTDIAVETFCSTFKGTLDGDGHTIYGSHDGTRQNKTYLFTYSDGATFKNLNFYNIRIDNRDNHNQAVITSQAKNGCVFENITFDKISTYVGDSHDNTGAAAAYATTNCIFKDITVKNSDFTADQNQSGAVVGHAMNCTFENIKVEHCESTARNAYSGGVAGRTDECTIIDAKILDSFIKTDGEYGGGVVGYSASSQLTNCIVDDQSCVCVDGKVSDAYAGGIVGYGVRCSISNCINSALIAADGQYAGGIIGNYYRYRADLEGCLNTGMVIAIKMDDVKNGFYNKYKTKTGMTCVTKTYQGKEYVIRKYDGEPLSHHYFGGIIGVMYDGKVSKCVNLGSVYSGNTYVGGILGTIEYGTISDCLSDFSGSNESNGICQFASSTASAGPNIKVQLEVSIDNCLNMTTYKDIYPLVNNWNGFSGSNNYSLTTASDVEYTNKTTAAKINSGEICLKLGANWEQHLGVDAYPTPTGSKGVYHTREVSNEFGTVCLPFALESNEDITYYTFNPDVKTDDSNVVLKFEKTDYVDAGKPVLFRASKTGELTFRNADSSFSGSPYYSMSEYFAWYIAGTYEQQVFTESTSPSSDRVYYVSDGKIRNTKTVTIAPYRAYFYGPSIDTLKGSAAANIRIIIEDEDGETTAISLINENYNENDNYNENENFGGKTYSLMGTEVNDSYRGIVIRNGKKVLRK